MPPERPSYCTDAKCTVYPGNGPCMLERANIQMWPTRKLRKRETARLIREAQENPTQVIRDCLNAYLRR